MEKINEEECEDSPEIRPDKLNKVDHIRQVSNPDVSIKAIIQMIF